MAPQLAEKKYCQQGQYGRQGRGAEAANLGGDAGEEQRSTQRRAVEVSGDEVRRAQRGRAARTREAVTVVRSGRASGRAARAARGATAPRGRPRGPGASRRSAAGRFRPSRGEQWQASMPKLDQKTRSRRSGATRAGAVNVVDQRTCSWHRLRQKGAGRRRAWAGAGRGAGAEAAAGRRAARDAAVALERTRGIGAANEPALVAMRRSER